MHALVRWWRKISFTSKTLLATLVVQALVSGWMLYSFYSNPVERQSNRWNHKYTRYVPIPDYVRPFANWDGQHYLLLADFGYRPASQSPRNKRSTAFFPLYPQLLGTFHHLVPSLPFAALLVSLLSSLCFMFWFSRVAAAIAPESPWIAVCVVLFWPSSFFLHSIYAEALFLALFFGFLYFYHLKKSYWSVLFAVLLPLAKGHALFLCVALGIYNLVRVVQRRQIRPFFEVAHFAGFALGGLLYLGFYLWQTGDALTGVSAQKGFIFNLQLSNIFDVQRFLTYLSSAPDGLFSYRNGLVDRAFVVLMLLGIPLSFAVKYKLIPIFYTTLTYCLASLGEGSSFIRFSLILVPLLALAIASAAKARLIPRLIVIVFLCASFLLQLHLASRFALNQWVG